MVQYPPMTLDQYLTENNETAVAFGARIDRATSTVTRLRNGETKPDQATLARIFAATNGQVTANDFWHPANEPTEAKSA